jgi:hypothetical protein
MDFIIKINGEPLEEMYCEIHHRWYWVDDEMNCCEQEREENE